MRKWVRTKFFCDEENREKQDNWSKKNEISHTRRDPKRRRSGHLSKGEKKILVCKKTQRGHLRKKTKIKKSGRIRLRSYPLGGGNVVPGLVGGKDWRGGDSDSPTKSGQEPPCTKEIPLNDRKNSVSKDWALKLKKKKNRKKGRASQQQRKNARGRGDTGWSPVEKDGEERQRSNTGKKRRKAGRAWSFAKERQVMRMANSWGCKGGGNRKKKRSHKNREGKETREEFLVFR